MELNLKNPLIFFDLETTGINITNDRIVEIAYVKVFPNNTVEEKVIRVNPEMHIPETSSKIHGIYDDDVKDCPKFKDIAKDLARIYEGADIAGYNSNKFDVPLLMEEFLRAGVDMDFSKKKFIDVQTIFHKMEQRTLVAAYKFYCDKNLDNAHGALYDTRATYEVLKAQLDRYKDVHREGLKEGLPNDVAKLAEFSTQTRNVDLMGRIIYNDKEEAVFNFGKYKGRPVSDVFNSDPGYYGWIMQGDFARNTKSVCTKIKMGIKLK